MSIRVSVIPSAVLLICFISLCVPHESGALRKTNRHSNLHNNSTRRSQFNVRSSQILDDSVSNFNASRSRTSAKSDNELRKLTRHLREGGTNPRVHNDGENELPNGNLTDSGRNNSHVLVGQKTDVRAIADNAIKKDTPTQESPTKHAPVLTLREIRLEMIKEQILRKLRLNEAPSLTRVEDFPESVHKALHHYQEKHDHHAAEQELDNEDDFEDESSFGKTEQVVVFPEMVQFPCPGFRDGVCLTFIVPDEIHVERVNNAELWIYELASNEKKKRQYSVTDLSRSGALVSIEDFQETQIDQWSKLNVTEIVSNWSQPNFSVLSKRQAKTLRIGCESCSSGPIGNGTSALDAASTSHKPFLIINMADAATKKRKRRSINCKPGIRECCRERLEVDFNEIEWSWIIEPRKYDAYFCKGSCFDIAGNVPNAFKTHTVHIQQIIQKRGLNNETQSMLPCCAATKMTGISLLYKVSNGTTVNKYLPNMVVDSCGCH